MDAPAIPQQDGGASLRNDLSSVQFDTVADVFVLSDSYGVTTVSAATNQVVANRTLSLCGCWTGSPAIDPRDGEIYFPTNTSVLELNGSTLATVLAITPGVVGLGPGTYDPVDGRLYWTGATNLTLPCGSTYLFALAPSNGTVLQRVPLPSCAASVTADPSTGELFVLTLGENGELMVFAPGTLALLKSLPGIGAAPPPYNFGVSFGPSGADFYIDEVSHLLVVDATSLTVTANRSLPFPISTLFEPPVVLPSGEVLVASASGLTELSPTNASPSRTLVLGCMTDSLVENPVNQEIYVGSYCPNRTEVDFLVAEEAFQVVTQTTVIPTEFYGPWGAGSGFYGLGAFAAVDPVTGVVEQYFALNSGGFAQLLGPYSLTFRATVWADGISWSLRLWPLWGGLDLIRSASPTVTLLVPNGTYNWSLTAGWAYAVTPTEGRSTVAGGGTEVAASATYTAATWAIFATLVSLTIIGAWYARRLRHAVLSRRAVGTAALRWDIEHPFTPEEETRRRVR